MSVTTTPICHCLISDNAENNNNNMNFIFVDGNKTLKDYKLILDALERDKEIKENIRDRLR